MKQAAAALPHTGDDSQPMLWLVLTVLAAIGVLCMGSKVRARFLSLVLCLVLLGTLCPAGLTLARAEESETYEFEDVPAEEDSADVFLQLCEKLTSTNPLTTPAAYVPAADEELEIGETVLVQGKSVDLTVILGVSEAAPAKETSVHDNSAIKYSKIQNMMNKSLLDTFVTGSSGTQVVYVKAHTGASTVLPSTGGSYPNSADYLYCLSGGEGVNSMTLFFNGSCQTESGWDAVIIYDGYGRYKGTFTGAALKNKVLTVSGSGVFIRLVTDNSFCDYYGFGLTRVIPNRTPTISSYTTNAAGKPVIRWNRLYGYTGYIVERASVSSSGSVGAFKALTNVANSSSTATAFSYTDNTAVKNTKYAYRLRQRFVYGTAKLVSPPSASVRITTGAVTSVPAPTLVSATASSSGITVRWNAVSGVSKYWVIRRTEGGSWATVRKGVSGTSYTDTTARSGVRYYYTMRCLASDGTTAISSYNTPGVSAVGQTVTATLSAPANVRVGTTQKGTVNICWNPVSNATGYEVYYSQYGSGSFTRYGTTSTASLTLTNLPASITKPVLKVRAYRTSGGSTTYSAYSSTVTGDPVTVRVLNIVEENFANGAASTRQNIYNLDVPRLTAIFNTATPYGRKVAATYSYKDQSKSQIISRIGTMASLADSNDVTIYTMGTHGASGTTSGSNAGALILSDARWITFGELATELKKIPGRVVILMQSCGSGAALADAAGRALDLPDGFDEAAEMDREILEAFANEDEKITLAEVEVNADGTVVADTGEFRVSNKFYVITASRNGENSWRSTVNGSYLFQWIQAGLSGGDANGDGTITLSEMGSYLTQKGNSTSFYSGGRYYYQHPQTYPSGSAFPLFVPN